MVLGAVGGTSHPVGFLTEIILNLSSDIELIIDIHHVYRIRYFRAHIPNLVSFQEFRRPM